MLINGVLDELGYAAIEAADAPRHSRFWSPARQCLRQVCFQYIEQRREVAARYRPPDQPPGTRSITPSRALAGE
jgi:hypothetical protein